MIDSDELEFYTEEEIREMIAKKERYVYVDNGLENFVIRRQDIPDFIVYINREIDSTDLEIFDPEEGNLVIIRTCGEFLDKCESEVREEIIERLIQLQTGEEEYSQVKVADENLWREMLEEREDEEEI
ncbi:MAG: hypothetical protein J6J60_00580 [Clostridia bacterium]|nr:hypothetical protein [Clostridia bacterium]